MAGSRLRQGKFLWLRFCEFYLGEGKSWLRPQKLFSRLLTFLLAAFAEAQIVQLELGDSMLVCSIRNLAVDRPFQQSLFRGVA